MTRRDAIKRLAQIKRELAEISLNLPLPEGMKEEERHLDYAIGEFHVASAQADLDRAIDTLRGGR